MMQLEERKKNEPVPSSHSPKMRLGISVPNFWAAAAAGSCDSVMSSFLRAKRSRM